MPIIQPAVALSTRQEAFCRHYAASGNAADAARQAGYSGRSARQTGCALLERPYVVERLRRIRLSWKRTERDEAQIMLARLEQVWDAAVASGSAYTMLRVLRFQAEIAGLVGPADRRARLWPVAHEDELGEIGAGEALEVGTEPGPLAEAVRSGRDRAERALARHHACREELEKQDGFDAAAHEEAARRLAEAVEERERLPVRFGPFDDPSPANDLPPADDPPGEAYEDCPWARDDGFGDDDRTDGTIDDDRADGAEHDWLYQRRNGYDEIYDPWAPEEREQRERERLEREEWRNGGDPFDPDDEDWDDNEDDEDGPQNGAFAPDHDIS